MRKITKTIKPITSAKPKFATKFSKLGFKPLVSVALVTLAMLTSPVLLKTSPAWGINIRFNSKHSEYSGHVTGNDKKTMELCKNGEPNYCTLNWVHVNNEPDKKNVTKKPVMSEYVASVHIIYATIGVIVLGVVTSLVRLVSRKKKNLRYK